MGQNKDALIRYKVLDECFKSRSRPYFKDELIEEIRNETGISITKRTLDEDVKNMQGLIESDSDVIIEKKKEGRKVYWQYSDANYSIFGALIAKEEKERIKAAVSLLSDLSGLPHFEWVQEIILKLKDNGDLEGDLREVVTFDTNVDLVGLKFLTPMYEAIINDRALEINYKDFKGNPPYKFTYHPQYLKEYNNRWFTLGIGEHEVRSHDPWITPLDRIVSISVSDKKYIKTEKNWNDYFDEVIGIIHPKGQDAIDVHLKVNKEQGKYVETKPLHNSQKDEWKDDMLHVYLNLIPNFELEREILSLGESVEIIEPQWLRKKIKGRIEQMLKKY